MPRRTILWRTLPSSPASHTANPSRPISLRNPCAVPARGRRGEEGGVGHEELIVGDLLCLVRVNEDEVEGSRGWRAHLSCRMQGRGQRDE